MVMVDEGDSLLNEVMQQLENILRREGSGFTVRAFNAFGDLGLMDPGLLPWSCRFRAFKRIGERMPSLVTGDCPSITDFSAIIAVRLGLWHRLVGQAKAHAEERIMFRRPLARQPSIMLQIVGLIALLCLLDEATERAVRLFEESPHEAIHGIASVDLLGWIRNSGKVLQNACQKITGGTGYMMDSGLAQTVRALEQAEALLRPFGTAADSCSPAGNSPIVIPERSSWPHPYSQDTLRSLMNKDLLPIARFDAYPGSDSEGNRAVMQLLFGWSS